MSPVDVPSLRATREIPPSPKRRIRPSTLLWLLIGIASIVLMTVWERSATPTDTHARKMARGPSETDFQAATTGETQTRYAFALLALKELDRTSDTGPTGEMLSSKSSVHSALDEAIKTYRQVIATPASPNVPRRLLVLEHLDGRKLDETLLTRSLPSDLRDLKIPEPDIKAEVVMWRSLYGPPGPPPPADAAQRIEKMHLRLAGTQALIDLYERRHDQKAADEQRRIRNQSATSFFLILIALVILGFVAIMGGIGLLLYALFNAIHLRFDNLGAVEHVAGRATFEDMIDVFAFYFAIFEFSRLFFSAALSYLSLGRSGNNNTGSNTPFLLLELGLYLTPHLVALAYLANTLKRREIPWDEVGLTTRHLAANIGYGILGYLAALPLMFLLGKLSELIFRNNPDITPNPALSLLASKEDALGRIILFLMVSIAAPLCEELFFRGVLLGGLRKRYGALVSILLSALAFALGHPIQDWLPILGLGIAFGSMRELRQSLVPSITAHFLQNSLTYIFLSMLFGGN